MSVKQRSEKSPEHHKPHNRREFWASREKRGQGCEHGSTVNASGSAPAQSLADMSTTTATSKDLIMNRTRWQDSFRTDMEKPLPLEFQQSFNLLSSIEEAEEEAERETNDEGWVMWTCIISVMSLYKFEVSLSSGDRLRFLYCTERDHDDSEP
ncbi:hypothetical protein PROFUN_06358 [Planoprotostelium fungivorum]|uniref:Uncharacterized protein n=1 Tax=Planoprotostelium fungivorum TaxID=1890364 RepID=A0A2P6NP83_9EUKA|nr:hypothetical protein PROFUN_06358 [Planoprotostelium fungivorum]